MMYLLKVCVCVCPYDKVKLLLTFIHEYIVNIKKLLQILLSVWRKISDYR